jgi:hypothetical protein
VGGREPKDLAVDTRLQKEGKVVSFQKRLKALGFRQGYDLPLAKAMRLELYQVNFEIKLRDLCDALECQPNDFKVPVSQSIGLLSFPGDANAPNTRHLHSSYFDCTIWIPDDADDKAVSLGESVVMCAIFVWEKPR